MIFKPAPNIDNRFLERVNLYAFDDQEGILGDGIVGLRFVSCICVHALRFLQRFELV